jgi:Domain of unknown function (DUF1963)
MSQNRTFDIIRLLADERVIFPASMQRESWMSASWIPHTEIDIPLGWSRYGGPAMDIPEGFLPPEGLRFAAQLDLGALANLDRSGLLPEHGQLLIFADIVNDVVSVSYHDVPNDALVRHVVEHEDHFFSGVLIKGGCAEVESMEERFRPKAAWDPKNTPAPVWDEFAGSDKSKMFGIYTNCQWDQKDVEGIISSGKLVLLQIGEDGFNDEGVFTVLIPKADLEKRDFSRCECTWAQT